MYRRQSALIDDETLGTGSLHPASPAVQFLRPVEIDESRTTPKEIE
jgi:hypothetical protein